MGDKDIITKEILKNIARELSRHLLNIVIEEDIEMIDKEFTRVEKREADLLFRHKEQIIHIEIQNNNHKSMHKRMLRYYSDIYFDFDKYEILQYLIYIGKNNCNMISTIKRDRIDYGYDIIDMKKIPCERFLKSQDPSAIALSILCDFEDKEKQEVVNTILRRLKEFSQDDLEFRNHLKMVEILSTNRNLEDYVDKGEEMLTVDIERMPSFNKGLQRGIEEATLKNAMIMIHDFKIAIDDVVRKLNIKKEELLEYMKKVESEKKS